MICMYGLYLRYLCHIHTFETVANFSHSQRKNFTVAFQAAESVGIMSELVSDPSHCSQFSALAIAGAIHVPHFLSSIL